LIETIVAISVLTVGLVAMATLMAEMSKNTSRSRYMSTASILASEKLEDLNKYPPSDPEVRVTAGTAGSLTADLSNTGVNYYDDVSLSATGGGITERPGTRTRGGAARRALRSRPQQCCETVPDSRLCHFQNAAPTDVRARMAAPTRSPSKAG